MEETPSGQFVLCLVAAPSLGGRVEVRGQRREAECPEATGPRFWFNLDFRHSAPLSLEAALGGDW